MYPQELRYAQSHEWAKKDGDLIIVGITSFAIEELTDLTYLQIDATVGNTLKKGEAFGVVESVKGTSDLFMPVSGKIVAVHNELKNKLETLTKDPHQGGWMIKVQPTAAEELNSLMDAVAYEKHVKASHH